MKGIDPRRQFEKVERKKDEETHMTTSIALASVGAGLAAIGAGVGIGQVWAAGIQSMSRQPEMASKIQTTMFIGAALVEGICLFALVICFLQM
jgi:F-type H+-transporting ATPase subunit c